MPLPNNLFNFANVIKLDRHIEILLLENDCVIVPGLGGFVAHRIPARYDEQDGLFLPPYRTLGFNAQLRMNDSLLVQSYVDAYDLSYPEALQQIENEVEEIYQALGEEGVFELNDLGSLSRNSDGNLAFEPFESGILTPLYYGLSSYEFPKLISNNQSATSIADIKPQKQGVVFVDDTDATNKRLSISMRAVRNVALQRSSLQLSSLLLSLVQTVTALLISSRLRAVCSIIYSILTTPPTLISNLMH